MENTDRDLLIRQSLRRKHSAGSNTDVSPEPEQEQRDESKPETEPESNQETSDTSEPPEPPESLGSPEPLESPGPLGLPEPLGPPESPGTLGPPEPPESPGPLGPPELKSDPPLLALIEFRIQQLQNRHFILQKTQELRKKAGEKSGETTDELSPATCEDSYEGCELEEIQKELEQLQVKKEKLEKQGHSSSITANRDQQKALSTSYKTDTPHGGIYMLPPAQLNHNGVGVEERVRTSPGTETSTNHITPVERLGKESMVTRCPSCEHIISTEIHPRVSETMWLLCCLFSMIGCVAGCCLIPFFMDSMKKVDHQCPHCQTNIHTYRPL